VPYCPFCPLHSVLRPVTNSCNRALYHSCLSPTWICIILPFDSSIHSRPPPWPGNSSYPTLLPPTSRPSPSIACVATRPSLLDLIFQSILSVFSALLLCPIDLPSPLPFLILILSLVDRSLVVLLLLCFRFVSSNDVHIIFLDLFRFASSFL
jgi:hypothetical protein